MSGMFRIALELSIPKIGFNILISLTVKKLDAFKFDEVAESDNTDSNVNSVCGSKFKVVLNADRRALFNPPNVSVES